MYNFKYCYYLAYIILIFVSCSRDNPSWDVGLLTPLVKSSLSLKELVSDSTLQSDSSGLVHLVYSRNINKISVDSFFSISDTTVSKSFAIDSLRLYNINVNYPFTLGSIAKQAGPIGSLIIGLNGNTLPIPAIGPLSVPKIEYNADTIFTSISLDDGKMDVRFENNLPIDITDVKFEIRNVNDNSLLVDGVFPLIKSRTTEAQTFSLMGKVFGSKLSIEVKNFSSPGSNNVPVLIDTSNSIIASLRVYDLRPNKATALWPAQNIIEQYLDFNLRRLNVQLTFAKIKSGKIFLKLKSTIDDTLHFYYDLPGATKNGNSFVIIKDLKPGTAANPSIIYEEYDFKGYDLDLSGTKKDTFNATPNTIIVRIDSTGIQKTFSKADNIEVELGFRDLKPTYARGYMGQDTFNLGPAEIDLDYFKDISGTINFSTASMNVVVENSIGTDLVGEIKLLKSINTNKNSKIDLNSSILNQTINIKRATDNNGSLPINSSITKIDLNKDNSNINSLISNLPDKIQYQIQMRSNPNGDLYGRKDFIYDGELLDMNLELDIPLQLSAQGLSFMKLVDFNPLGLDLENVIDGTLHFFVANGYPLGADLKLEFISLNGQNEKLEYLVDVIAAPGIQKSNFKVDPVESRNDIPIKATDIENLKKCTKIRISSTLNTRDYPQEVRIMDEFNLDLLLTASFNYKIN